MPELPFDIAVRQRRATRAELPAGGATGRVLMKGSSADYDASWMAAPLVPAGGVEGDVLTKLSYAEADYDWRTPPTLPPGGTTGQVLTKIDGTDFNADWEDAASGSSGFPVGPEDDGTATHLIEIDTPGGGISQQIASATADADNDRRAEHRLFTQDTTDTALAFSGVASADTSAGHIQVTSDGGGSVLIDLLAAANGGTTAGVEVQSDSGGDSFVAADATQMNFTVSKAAYLAGPLITTQNSAPANGDFGNSSFGLWLDDTPGATVLHVKAKDSGGTVRTASIPLS